jgi:hypothetical protein
VAKSLNLSQKVPKFQIFWQNMGGEMILGLFIEISSFFVPLHQRIIDKNLQ